MLVCKNSLLRSLFTFVVFSIVVTIFYGFHNTQKVSAIQLDEIASLSLVAKPEFPEPNSDVTVSVDDYTLNTLGATIRWYVDGVEQTDKKNERSIQLKAGPLGTKKVVRVEMTKIGVPAYTSSKTIFPTNLDLIMEANTYVPSFYKGRALPSSESTVRLIALIYDDTNTPLSDYSYKWTNDNTVLFGGPVKGKNIISLTMPRYEGKLLSVEVFDKTGAPISKKFLRLNAANPELHFYEQSPLRGLAQKELVSPFPLLGEETTIFGEPYYLNTTLDTGSANFDWKINNKKTMSDQAAPNAITLRRVGGSGSASVDLEIVTKRTIPQFVSDSFKIFFE